MVWFGIVILFVVLLVYHVYRLQFATVDCPIETIDSADLKTGDLLLFKAYNNINSLKHGNYYGHVGIVVVLPPNDEPFTGVEETRNTLKQSGILIFEANLANLYGPDSDVNNRIFLSPLADRIAGYPGRVYVRRLAQPIAPETIEEFHSFIQYSLDNMRYEPKVAENGFKKLFRFKRCDHDTDCGQLVFLSYIKLGLLSINSYDEPVLDHLRYVCNLQHLVENRLTDQVQLIVQ